MRYGLIPAIALVALAIPSLSARAQQQPTPAISPIPANPNDVDSPESLLKALYDVISGPKGGKRDFDRFRSLFYPGGRLMPTRLRGDGRADALNWTPDEWIARAQPLFDREGFYEKQVAVKLDRFGNIAHAFSTYESRHDPKDATPFARGINSIQMINDGTRWWVITIFWDAERPGLTVPPKYMKNGS